MLGMEVRFLFAALECLLSIKVYYKGFVNLRYQFDSVRRLLKLRYSIMVSTEDFGSSSSCSTQDTSTNKRIGFPFGNLTLMLD